MTARHEFTGASALSATLRGMAEEVRTEVLARAVTKASVPIRSSTKRNAPRDTGALAASVQTKVVADEKKGHAYALTGPDRSYYRGKKKLGKKADNRGASRPANYVHLVEWGHVTGTGKGRFGGFAKGAKVRKGTAIPVGFVPGTGFMRRGFDEGSPRAEQIMINEIEGGIERARARRVAAGTHRA